MAAAVDYLAALGRRLTGTGAGGVRSDTRHEDCHAAMCAIRAYEQALSRELLRVLRAAGASIHGLAGEEQLAQRVPTVLFNLPGVAPAAVTQAAADAGIGIRDGHMYAPRLMRRLGLALDSGAVRASLVHYNTVAEIHRFGEALARMSRPR